MVHVNRETVTGRHRTDCCVCHRNPRGTRVVVYWQDGHFKKQQVFCSDVCYFQYWLNELKAEDDLREADLLAKVNGRAKANPR